MTINTYITKLDPFISDLKNDRYNKQLLLEINECIEKFDTSGIKSSPKICQSDTLKFNPKIIDYNSIHISDLEAQFITCPLYIIMYFYRKQVASSMKSLMFKETLDEVQVYGE